MFVVWIRIIESTYLHSFFVSLKMKVVNKVFFSNSKDLINKLVTYVFLSAEALISGIGVDSYLFQDIH